MNLQAEPERYALTNGVVADGMGLFLRDGAILIEGDKIEAVGTTDQIGPRAERSIDVGGRLIIPGLTNAHHHLYSSLAVGLEPVGPTGSFIEILENLWWRLDGVLDEESVYISALVGIVDSVKHGVTTIFDHHASMNFVRGSLDVVASAFDLSGITGVLCFEASDRGDLDEHIAENIDLFEKTQQNHNIRGIFGMHANLTLGENSLAKIAESKPPDMPIHIHCGEAADDLDFCRALGYEGPVDRLAAFGLIDDRSILVHCVHLSDTDYRLIEELSPTVVTNPESNSNNRVGAMDRERIAHFVFGTDGMSGDMVSQMRHLFLQNSGESGIFEELRRAFFDDRYALRRKFFENSGAFKSGETADIAVLDYIPITPIDNDNLLSHLIFGTKNARAYYTISSGKVLCDRGEIVFLDEKELFQKAQNAAKQLHERFYG